MDVGLRQIRETGIGLLASLIMRRSRIGILLRVLNRPGRIYGSRWISDVTPQYGHRPITDLRINSGFVNQ
jgi:hypothetical protein